jgi:RTX calcium-binding nonapeptide repeat (4 copies)
LRANEHVTVDARLLGAMLVAATTLLLLPALFSTAAVYGKASHDGWPTNNCNWRKHPHGQGCGVYRSHNKNQNGVIRGTGRSDELLGGHGDDVIRGGPAGDVIWGDFWPCCQPAGQSDYLSGGDGNDFLYASHGRNAIDGGSGNDVIHAHFGQGGSIDCGSGYDVLYVSHRTKPRYSRRDCERISFSS